MKRSFYFKIAFLASLLGLILTAIPQNAYAFKLGKLGKSFLNQKKGKRPIDNVISSAEKKYRNAKEWDKKSNLSFRDKQLAKQNAQRCLEDMQSIKEKAPKYKEDINKIKFRTVDGKMSFSQLKQKCLASYNKYNSQTKTGCYASQLNLTGTKPGGRFFVQYISVSQAVSPNGATYRGIQCQHVKSDRIPSHMKKYTQMMRTACGPKSRIYFAPGKESFQTTQNGSHVRYDRSFICYKKD